MEQLLSPKQVARAIDVSESSLKRWCDQGLIPTVRTAGGHRRLPISGVLEFIRQGDHNLVRPDLLGLPATSGLSKRVIERSREALLAALLEGDHDRCRQILLDLYLSPQSIATIGDTVLCPAFELIGKHWECGAAEVYQERRACEVAMRSLLEIAQGIPAPPPEARCALGAAAWDDFYQLPTLLVELVFRSQGWKAISLGSALPADTLRAAVAAFRPEVFWLSVSYIANEEKFLSEYGRLYEAIGKNVRVIVGGRALTPEIRESMKYAEYCESLEELEQLL